MSKLYDYLFKIIVNGDTNTGKTSLINTITTTNTNTDTLPTIGIDFASAHTVIDNNIHIKFHIWDTAGQEQFARVITHYYKNIAGGVIVFDLHKKNTFEKATTFWFQELKKNTNDTRESASIYVANNLLNTNPVDINNIKAPIIFFRKNIISIHRCIIP